MESESKTMTSDFIERKTMVGDFIELQKNLPKLQKTEENPFFKSKYVPLDQILDKVLPVINKYNFALSQTVHHDGENPTLRTELLHTSGSTLSSEMLLLVKTPDPQGQGSGITYARRYALVSMLGMMVGEDDDGNAATTAEAKAQEDARQQTSPIAVKGFYETLKSRGVNEKAEAETILDLIDPHWRQLNTSGIARVQKQLNDLQPDTIAEILAGAL